MNFIISVNYFQFVDSSILPSGPIILNKISKISLIFHSGSAQ